MKKLCIVLLGVIGLITSCGNSVETPQQGLAVIATLYAQRDFDTLVRTRYAEIYKAEDEAQIQLLVERFSSRFANEEHIASAIAAYEEAAKLEPILSENGTVALFKLKAGSLKISLMKNGKWGFHL